MSAVEIKQTPPTIDARRRAKDIVRPVIVDVYRRFLSDKDAGRDKLTGMLEAAYPLVELHPLFAQHALRCRLKTARVRPKKWDLLCEVKHPNVKGPYYIVAIFSCGPYRTAFVKEPRFPPAPSSTGTAPMHQRLVDWDCAYASEWRHRRDCVALMSDGFKAIFDMGTVRSYDD